MIGHLHPSAMFCLSLVCSNAQFYHSLVPLYFLKRWDPDKYSLNDYDSCLDSFCSHDPWVESSLTSKWGSQKKHQNQFMLYREGGGEWALSYIQYAMAFVFVFLYVYVYIYIYICISNCAGENQPRTRRCYEIYLARKSRVYITWRLTCQVGLVWCWTRREIVAQSRYSYWLGGHKDLDNMINHCAAAYASIFI